MIEIEKPHKISDFSFSYSASSTGRMSIAWRASEATLSKFQPYPQLWKLFKNFFWNNSYGQILIFFIDFMNKLVESMCSEDKTEEPKTEINNNPNIWCNLYCTLTSSRSFQVLQKLLSRTRPELKSAQSAQT